MSSLKPKKQGLRAVNEQLQENLTHLLEQLTKQEQQNHILLQRIKELEKKKNTTQNTPQKDVMVTPQKHHHPSNILEETRRVGDYLDFELKTKSDDVRKLQEILEERTRELAEVKVSAEQEWHRSKDQQKVIEFQQQRIQTLEQDLHRLSTTNDVLLASKNKDACYQIELEHLRRDNQKYLEMLQCTKEFKQTAEQYQAPEGRGRYLFKVEDLAAKQKISLEKLLWVPEKAHQFSLDFRQKYAQNGQMISEELMELLLFELNKVWSKKVQNDMNVLRRSCQSQVSKIQRQKSDGPLSEKDAQTTIERLRKDITRLEKENRELFARRPQSNPENGENLKDSFIKQRAQQKVMERKDKKISQLESTLKKTGLDQQKQVNEKLMYYDGALWATRQITDKLKEAQSISFIQEHIRKIEAQVINAQRNIS